MYSGAFCHLSTFSLLNRAFGLRRVKVYVGHNGETWPQEGLITFWDMDSDPGVDAGRFL